MKTNILITRIGSNGALFPREGLYTQLRQASNGTTVIATGQALANKPGYYQFTVNGTDRILPLALFIATTENGTYTLDTSWGGDDGKQLIYVYP